MSRRIEVPLSTLSKVERNELTLTYTQLRRVMEKLALRPADLFEDAAALPVIGGWRSIERSAAVTYEPMGDHDAAFLCADLRQKRMTPVLVRITAKQPMTRSAEFCSSGEEYLYVLAGCVEVNTELYASVVLQPGDSVYLDSRMMRTYAVAKGCVEANALLVCSAAER